MPDRMNLARRFGLVASLLVLSLGCLPADAAETTLRRTNSAEPESLDPQKITGQSEASVVGDLFEPLIALDADRHPVPGAAQSWDISDDKKTWTFHLRPGAQWSDGSPLTAADWVYSFRRLVDPATGAAKYEQIHSVVNAEEIASGREKDITKLGIVAVDADTLRFTLNQPQLILPLLISDHGADPVPRAAVEKWGSQWTRPGHILSNGPYKLESWNPHDKIVLIRNPLFHDAAHVAIDRVEHYPVDDDNRGVKQYRAGELDWARLPKSQLAWARKEMAGELHSGDALFLWYVFFNMKHGALAGPEHQAIREALSLAVDRQTIVDKIDPRGQKPAYSMISSLMPDYTPQAYDWQALPYAERLTRAKHLMAAAGYDPAHPLKLTLSYTTSDDTRTYLLALGAMWKPIGVEVTLDNMEWAVYQTKVRQLDYEMGVLSEIPDFDDPSEYLVPYRSDAGLYNHCGYANPAFDALMDKASFATDLPARRAALEGAERTVLADYALVPLQFGVANYLVNPHLVGRRDSLAYPQTRHLSFKD
ncbi:MAG: peptide transporter substrate-binding protein [Rhodospirillales bacterium]|nr:peptide transporter substrate-binding protein [Rhodospirillales bacterium]